MQEDIEISRLPNGFRVITEHMPSFASASVGVWVNVGARSELQHENGVAHFLEHMAFKGTRRRSARQIAEEIEDVGGSMNAYTGRDRTAYVTRTLTEDVPLAIDILADILQNASLAEPEIERERGVILQEIGESLDTPDDIIFDWLQQMNYPDQPLGRPILGTRETVCGINRLMLEGYMQRHYAPGSMVLAAAGGLEHTELQKLAAEAFGGLAPSSAAPPIRATFSGGEFRRERELEQAHVALAFPAPGFADIEALLTAQIASAVIGGGMSSRLFQEIREERGLCYSVYSFLDPADDTGTFTIYSGTGGDAVREMCQTLVDVLREAAANISGAEVARARAQFKAGTLMARESATTRAERLARQTLVYGHLIDTDMLVAMIDAVDHHKVRQFLEQMLGSTMSLALYGPVSTAPSIETMQARLRAA